jgi:hypothetical protein
VPPRAGGTETGDGCVYDCNEPWTMWATPGSYNRQCRDPFVTWDEAQARWVMFATAKSTNGYGVVTVAYSDDLRNWRGAGYIDATRRLDGGTGAQTTGGQAENPFVISRGGKHYLLFSDWRDHEDDCTKPNPRTLVQYAVSTELTADAEGGHNWLYRGRTHDPGVNAIEVQRLGADIWIMSQSVSNPNCCDHPLHRRDLRLRQIVWGEGDQFTTTGMLTLPCRAARVAARVARPR